MSESIVPHAGDSRQPQQFDFEGFAVRTVLDENGDPLFVASDVCKVLGIVDVKQAVERLDDDERGRYSVPTGGGIQQTTCINESGLYNLILRSNKPEAKAFKRWITHEVLPTLRKTGSYSVQQMTPAEAFLQIAQNMVKVERQIAELHDKQSEQAQQIEAVVERLDNADYFTILQWCQSQGIKATPSIRQMWGKQASELSRAHGIEIDRVIEGPYSVHSYHKSVLQIVCVAKQKTHGQLPLPKGK